MDLGSKARTLLCITGFIVGSELIWELIYRLYKRKFYGSTNSKNLKLDTVVTDDNGRPVPTTNLTKPIKPSKLKNENELDLRKPPDLWNTVLFFPDPTSRNMEQFLQYFEETWVSIDMCIFLASMPQLIEILETKLRQGVKIRVITDFDTVTAHNNKLCDRMKKLGVPVRTKSTGTLMHNKFVVLDEEAVITGSCNFTNMGVMRNHENLVISTNQEIVTNYLDEFNKIWNYFGENQA